MQEQPESKEAWFKKWFQRDNLIILVLSGILLFIIALPIEDGTTQKNEGARTQTKQENGLQGSIGSTDNMTAVQNVGSDSENASEYDYVVYLEEKLESTLGDISGVGKVEVMLTLQSSEELVVEKDTPVSRSNTNETDSEGGSRVISQTDTQETTIYRTEGSDSEPYVVKTILPKVEGVLVVAQGAGKGTVDKSITEIVQALFGVEAHKVKVVAMVANE